ncbi:MAG: SMI1/KNR4 family protein [Fluviicoccus sp.]|uniref:SMI1/KNR4 family protein n=1 Tax=Fluviicoccus sp. TaxID=2003552 RepID=UPI00271AF419|nr:SMI1/KNR4 family protein [Fluviicoccus sp.]MDO8330674.1 SMI1/KNR4 family protein [Fluviicoccus sp.]
MAELYGLDGEEPNSSLTIEMVRHAEKKLGYKLPESYLRVLRMRNGGYVTPVSFDTGYEIPGQGRFIVLPELFGIGYREAIDGEYGSSYFIKEWGYPDIGVVISSEGHTAIMLDYSECGPTGEPAVTFVDVEWSDGPHTVRVADTFEDFFLRLEEDDSEGW